MNQSPLEANCNEYTRNTALYMKPQVSESYSKEPKNGSFLKSNESNRQPLPRVLWLPFLCYLHIYIWVSKPGPFLQLVHPKILANFISTFRATYPTRPILIDFDQYNNLVKRINVLGKKREHRT